MPDHAKTLTTTIPGPVAFLSTHHARPHERLRITPIFGSGSV